MTKMSAGKKGRKEGKTMNSQPTPVKCNCLFPVTQGGVLFHEIRIMTKPPCRVVRINKCFLHCVQEKIWHILNYFNSGSPETEPGVRNQVQIIY